MDLPVAQAHDTGATLHAARLSLGANAVFLLSARGRTAMHPQHGSLTIEVSGRGRVFEQPWPALIGNVFKPRNALALPVAPIWPDS